jgi:hypothetical protein
MRLIAVVLVKGTPTSAVSYISSAKAILSLDLSQLSFAYELVFPFVLAIIFLFFPVDYTTSRITTAVIGSFCIPMTFFVSNSLRNSLSKEGIEVNVLISYISCLLVAVHPYLIYADGRGLREPLLTLILLVILRYIFEYRVKPTRKSISIITFFCILLFSVKLEYFLFTGCLIFFLIFYDFSHIDKSNFKWRRYSIVTIVLISTFFLEILSLSFIYKGFIIDLRVSAYFRKEFGYYESVTLFEYLFEHHSLTQLFEVLYHGIGDSLGINRWVYGLFGFCLILIGLFYLVSRNSFEIPVCIILSIVSQAFFVHTWKLLPDLWHFFLPFAPFACICIGYTLIMVIKTIKIQITPTKKLNINRFILVMAVLAYLVFVYSLESLRLVDLV